MVTNQSYESDIPPNTQRSFDSYTSDEGYHTDENDEVPILKSTRIIQLSYSYITYTLSFAIILLSAHIVYIQPFPWGYTFPPVFILFHLLFHITHLSAHVFGWLQIERHCVIYGTWLYCTGWLLTEYLFSERLYVAGFTKTTTFLFWMLMLERRHAWGILVWEFTNQLDSKDNEDRNDKRSKRRRKRKEGLGRLWELGSFRLFVFRVWCLLGTGSFWALVYIGLAKWDGYAFKYLFQIHHVIQLLLVSTIGGLMMVAFWSFWTFQYKGVLWQKELRKGIVVWYSEGVAYAAEMA